LSVRFKHSIRNTLAYRSDEPLTRNKSFKTTVTTEMPQPYLVSQNMRVKSEGDCDELNAKFLVQSGAENDGLGFKSRPEATATSTDGRKCDEANSESGVLIVSKPEQASLDECVRKAVELVPML